MIRKVQGGKIIGSTSDALFSIYGKAWSHLPRRQIQCPVHVYSGPWTGDERGKGRYNTERQLNKKVTE